jgi:hypothetical protein
MTTHKFAVDELVSLQSPSIHMPDGPFRVVRCLPSERAQFFYRVRSSAERFERVVEEHQIHPLVAAAGDEAGAQVAVQV